MRHKTTIAILLDAVEAASSHLEYCNYGDERQRSCAEQAGLRAQLERAKEIGNREFDLLSMEQISEQKN